MKMTAFDNRFIIFPILFLLIYIFAAAVPLGSDIYLKPVWVHTITPDTAQAELEGIDNEAETVEQQVAAAQFAGKTP